MSDPVDLYRRARAEFDRRVAAIGDDQWDNPTPCTDWNVRALVNHLVYENLWAPPLFAGKTIADVGDAYEGDQLGDNPKAAWASSSQAALEAVERPGAMNETVHLSFGDFPGSNYAIQLYLDLAVHAWDLAKGIGADDTLDPGLAAACLAEAEPMEDMIRQSGMFGDKVDVPADAPAQDRLLGLVGRRR